MKVASFSREVIAFSRAVTAFSMSASVAVASAYTALSAFAASFTIFLNHKKEGLAAMVAASLIAFSRMYLFVHFPSDILGGIVLGILTAFAAKWLSDKFVKNRLATKG